jgi:hypothetical protein
MFRASGVPEECMWDFAQFKQYLASIGKGNEWDASIYPSMCETITVVVLDHLKRNLGKMHSLSSFQLLGADFALTENLEPWLIEINSNPGLSPNTYVINNVVTTLLKDIIKGTAIKQQYRRFDYCDYHDNNTASMLYYTKTTTLNMMRSTDV